MSCMEFRAELGNTAKSAGEGITAWRAFLRAGNHAALIDRVILKLHPTFKDPVIVLAKSDENGAFVCGQHTGWGVFSVDVEVQWSPTLVSSPKTTRLSHMLSFSAPETSKVISESLELYQVAPQARDSLLEGAGDLFPGVGRLLASAFEQSPEPNPEPGRTLRSNPTLQPSVELLSRRQATDLLKRTSFFDHTDKRFFHGRMFPEGTAAPRMVWQSTLKPRDGSQSWLTATEFQDTPEVFKQKVKVLADLLQVSQKTTCYTGAGISVAAGIGMAAVGSSGGNRGMDAEPTLTHHTLSTLHAAGYLHGWVQQNHDGLPQKAGYPQEAINEIHGSWYDPSNPVVKYDGTLRGELCENMQELADTADLCLVMGTSLTGLNADQMATTPAKRSRKGTSLGTVIISPQQTAQDGKSSIRIFAQADDVMRELAEQLRLQVNTEAPDFPASSRVLVPYDQAGRPTEGKMMYLDLRPGQKVRVSAHNNIEGARQPSYMHIDSDTVGTVSRRNEATGSIHISFGGATMTLGIWWLEAARRGAIDQLPVVNMKPEIV